MNSLSLYVIEDALLELTDARESLLAEREASIAGLAQPRPDLDAELAEVEKHLAAYFQLETRKVDNIHSFLRWCKETATAARAEANRFLDRARVIENTKKHIDRLVLDVMEAAGKKKVDGTAGRCLARQGNGGVFPLQVDGWDADTGKWTIDPAPLPDEFVDVVVCMPRPLYAAFLRHAAAAGVGELLIEELRVLASKPADGRLRAALAEECPICRGRGTLDDPDYPVAPGAISKQIPCSCCDGGKRKIAGARLLPRGEHLRVK